MSRLMRTWFIFLVMAVTLQTGCSAFIADAGKDVGSLKTREQVRGAFGNPIGAGVQDGDDYEVFRTRRKLANIDGGETDSLLFVRTLGLTELVLFPWELSKFAFNTINGVKLCFWYDSTGSITALMINGERYGKHLYGPRKTPDETKGPDQP